MHLLWLSSLTIIIIRPVLIWLLYEALYGRKCRTPLYWDEAGERKLEDIKLNEGTLEKIKIIRNRLKAAQDR